MKFRVFLCAILLLPSVAFSQKKWDSKKEKYPKVKDEGVMDLEHKRHVGGIAWANDSTATWKPDASTFKDKFNVTEYIYGRAFFAHSIQNEAIFEITAGKKTNINPPCAEAECKFGVRLFINDEFKFKVACGVIKGEALKQTSYQILLRPMDEDGATDELWKEIIEEDRKSVV